MDREINEHQARKRKEEDDRRTAAERQKQEAREAAARAKLEAQERRRQVEAERAAEAEERRKAEIIRKQQEAVEAKERAQRARRLAADIESKRKAEADLQKRLLAIETDTKQSPALRSLAAIAAGRQPLNLQKKSHQPVGARSTEEMLRATMTNPKESPAARQLAAIGLGVDPGSIKLAGPSGRALTTDQLRLLKERAAPLKPPTAGQVAPNVPQSSSVPQDIVRSGKPAMSHQTSTSAKPDPRFALNNPSTFRASIQDRRIYFDQFFSERGVSGSTPKIISPAAPNSNKDIWKTFQKISQANNAFLASKPGQIFTETLSAAGGPLAGKAIPTAAKALKYGSNAASAVEAFQKRDWLDLAQKTADKTATGAAGALGGMIMPWNPKLGASVGAGTTQFVLTTYRVYLAPVAGDALVKHFPDLFIPPSQIPQVP